MSGTERKDVRPATHHATPGTPEPCSPGRVQEGVAQGGGVASDPPLKRGGHPGNPTSASTGQGTRTPGQKHRAPPTNSPARADTGDPTLQRGWRPGIPPAECRGGTLVPAAEEPNAPPPMGNPAVTGPRRGQTSRAPRGCARRPGNLPGAQNPNEAFV